MSVLQTTSTRDALVNELRRRILSGELRPGTPLTEASLASKFGVARPTVRSALQVLVSRRLVQPSDGRSLIVPILTEADIRDLFVVRTPLELLAVQLIIENEQPLEDVAGRLREMADLPTDTSWADLVEAHTRFHVALIDAAGSPRLSRIYPPLQEEMQLCLAQLKSAYPEPADLAEEHSALLAAIAGGDGYRAAQEMQAHLGRAVSHFISL